MTNNKQQTVVEIFWNQLPEIIPFTVNTETAVKLDEAYQQAKEMEVMGKEMSYADGYAEGYKRALDYMTMSIKNAIETK
jgi:hypothetical protein